MKNQTQRVRLWAKAIILLTLAALAVTFLLLNMNAVVEPRVHLIFFTYERPGLLLVLLLTVLAGAVLWTLIRTVPQLLRQARTSRAASRMAGMEDEIAELKARPTHAVPAAMIAAALSLSVIGAAGCRAAPSDGGPTPAAQLATAAIQDSRHQHHYTVGLDPRVPLWVEPLERIERRVGDALELHDAGNVSSVRLRHNGTYVVAVRTNDPQKALAAIRSARELVEVRLVPFRDRDGVRDQVPPVGERATATSHTEVPE